MMLAELRREAAIETGFYSDKMFQLKKEIGDDGLLKLLVFILKAFQDSLKITTPANELSPSELMEAADKLMGMGPGEYGRESILDVLAALKQFKQQPFELFNSFSDVKLMQIMTNYLEVKGGWLEIHNSRKKATNQEGIETVKAIEAKFPGTVAKLGRIKPTPKVEQFDHVNYIQLLPAQLRRMNMFELERLLKEAKENNLTDVTSMVVTEIDRRRI